MKDEVDLLPTDKCQRSCQIAIIILGACGEARPITENNKFTLSF